MDCWKKLYNNFILEKMWPLLSNDNLSEIALEIMATLGTFGLSADPTKNDKPGVQQLFELMIQVLAVDNTSLNSIQTTALKGAYMLSAHDISRLNQVRKCDNLRVEIS
ncbi:hypothetical protein MFLAVUS_004482 [Mucor flavus]|uniref:Uncharacterized protein n=1 Tax=Mucor flavus TaxID=439312 RepID=A0ABP9YW12_9FUNG